MTQDDLGMRRATAAKELNEHAHRQDGERIVTSLDSGLRTLRDLFFTRVHVEVEKEYGMDSMLSPISLVKSEVRTKAEIDCYQVAESAAEARAAKSALGTGDWYANWLLRLRVGEQATSPAVLQRLAHYASREPDDRRRAFATVLEKALPEARHAPLIIYRMLPLAVAIVTDMALGEHRRALEGRKRQTTLLSSINDCPQCHGNLLENGEQCAQCGNPMWKYEWLTAE
ncbi:MAG: hypothetical protein AB7O62_26215 [Pirellulales bacterium]